MKVGHPWGRHPEGPIFHRSAMVIDYIEALIFSFCSEPLECPYTLQFVNPVRFKLRTGARNSNSRDSGYEIIDGSSSLQFLDMFYLTWRASN